MLSLVAGVYMQSGRWNFLRLVLITVSFFASGRFPDTIPTNAAVIKKGNWKRRMKKSPALRLGGPCSTGSEPEGTGSSPLIWCSLESRQIGLQQSEWWECGGWTLPREKKPSPLWMNLHLSVSPLSSPHSSKRGGSFPHPAMRWKSAPHLTLHELAEPYKMIFIKSWLQSIKAFSWLVKTLKIPGRTAKGQWGWFCQLPLVRAGFGYLWGPGEARTFQMGGWTKYNNDKNQCSYVKGKECLCWRAARGTRFSVLKHPSARRCSWHPTMHSFIPLHCMDNSSVSAEMCPLLGGSWLDLMVPT